MIYIGGRGVLQTCEALEAGLRRMLGVGKLAYVRATRARPGLAPAQHPPPLPRPRGRPPPSRPVHVFLPLTLAPGMRVVKGQACVCGLSRSHLVDWSPWS